MMREEVLLELFHTLAEPESAAARRLLVDTGLVRQVNLRNVFYEEVARDLAARGGDRTPALWDGERLHVGLAAIEEQVARLRAAPP